MNSTVDMEIKIKDAVALVMNESNYSSQQRDEFIELFEQFECWTPFFKLLEEKQSKKSDRDIEDYIKAAKVQNIYLENTEKAADICLVIVKEFEISFSKFQMEILPRIIEHEDYEAEASILSHIADSYFTREDIITCYERLAMLYEKKIYNDTKLSNTFEKLIKFDSGNLRALRYFKLVYTQEQDWKNVAKLLVEILKNVKHKQEKFRVAQELATVYLYQLDQPKNAIEKIDLYCSDSPLDTTKIKFDAYSRMADWSNCLKVLENSLTLESDITVKAVIHYKIAELYEKMDQVEVAKKHYEKASLIWTDFIEPYEKMISIELKQKNWQQVIKLLDQLSDKVNLPNLKDSLREAMLRIESATHPH